MYAKMSEGVMGSGSLQFTVLHKQGEGETTNACIYDFSYLTILLKHRETRSKCGKLHNPL